MNYFLHPLGQADARRELSKMGVSSQGISVMWPKFFNLAIKICNLTPGEANILKQEMISTGADAAVAKGVAEGTTSESDIILLGSPRQLKRLGHALDYHKNHRFPQLQKELQALIDQWYTGFTGVVNARDTVVEFTGTKVMGILNVTPDSFSDGGKWLDQQAALEHALQMERDGAFIIDVGGESTRPGAMPVDDKEEIARVIPLVKAIKANSKILVSIDTQKAAVAAAAIDAGADLINDVSALTADPEMTDLLIDHKEVPVILMHMAGNPQNMQANPCYNDVVGEVFTYLQQRVEACQKVGIDRQRILLDPGIGFGKRQQDNLILLKNLYGLHALGCPVVLGASRKSFIGNIHPSTPQQRLEGSLATTALAYQQKVHLVRVHDVAAHTRMLKTLKAVEQAV